MLSNIRAQRPLSVRTLTNIRAQRPLPVQNLTSLGRQRRARVPPRRDRAEETILAHPRQRCARGTTALKMTVLRKKVTAPRRNFLQPRGGSR